MTLPRQFPPSPLFLLPFPDGVNLRLFLSLKTLPQLLLPYIFDRGASYGASPSSGLRDPSAPESGAKKLLIEFSSPNIATKFHGAHLRSTILGAHIAALHGRMGWDVTSINYLGDWGKQMGLLAAGWARFGSDDAFAADPLRHLLDVYNQVEELFKPELEARNKIRDLGGDPEEVEARVAEHDAQGLNAERDAWFKKLEDGDEEAAALWRRFRDVSIEQYIKLYARLGVAFDEYSGESQVSAASIAAVEAALKEKGVYEEDHGAWAIDFKKHGGAKGLDRGILRFRTGSTSYLLRDIAAVLDRAEKHKFDKMIYIVSADQATHFKKVSKALELMGREDLAASIQLVHFGHVHELELPGGGQASLLGDFLDYASGAAGELLQVDVDRAARLGDPVAAADALGASAIMVHALHGKKAAQLSLDLTAAVTFEGETGICLQYWHARLCEMLRSSAGPAAVDYSVVDGEEYGDVLRLLAQYPDTAKAALRNLEPGPLLAYLYRLVDELAACLPEDEEWPAASGGGGIVYSAVRQVLENGLLVLGVPVVGR